MQFADAFLERAQPDAIGDRGGRPGGKRRRLATNHVQLLAGDLGFVSEGRNLTVKGGGIQADQHVAGLDLGTTHNVQACRRSTFGMTDCNRLRRQPRVAGQGRNLLRRQQRDGAEATCEQQQRRAEAQRQRSANVQARDRRGERRHRQMVCVGRGIGEMRSAGVGPRGKPAVVEHRPPHLPEAGQQPLERQQQARQQQQAGDQGAQRQVLARDQPYAEANGGKQRDHPHDTSEIAQQQHAPIQHVGRRHMRGVDALPILSGSTVSSAAGRPCHHVETRSAARRRC